MIWSSVWLKYDILGLYIYLIWFRLLHFCPRTICLASLALLLCCLRSSWCFECGSFNVLSNWTIPLIWFVCTIFLNSRTMLLWLLLESMLYEFSLSPFNLLRSLKPFLCTSSGLFCLIFWISADLHRLFGLSKSLEIGFFLHWNEFS